MSQARFAFLMAGLALLLFFGILLFLELGRRIGIQQTAKRGAAARSGVGVVDSAIYSVLALFLGFAFSGAASRFDARRQLIAEEVSATSTAWQRIDLLPAESQEAIRASFRRYLDAMLSAYAATGSVRELTQARDALNRAENDLWGQSVTAVMDPSGEKARMLLLPSLTEMFDLVSRARLARRIHTPPVVYVMLAVMVLGGALFAGYAMASASRNWIHVVGVAATISLAMYVILELEYPRLGFVRVDGMTQALVDLRATLR